VSVSKYNYLNRASDTHTHTHTHTHTLTNGFILFIVLLFLFVLTLLAVSGGEDIILDNKMQHNMQNDFSVFTRAQFGLQQEILALQGKSMSLPDSPISLNVTEKTMATDKCGNQTIDIQSTARNSFSTVILNSRTIFAKVPRVKKCKKIPKFQIVWWQVK